MTDDNATQGPTDAPIDALTAGDSFGPFELVAPIGRGAFGVVYEARRRPSNRRVALKVLHPHVLVSAEARRRFEREVAAAAAVEHPHVVAVLDGGMLEGRGFLAMAFLDGESLSDRLRAKSPLAVEDAVDALLPVAAALDAVHAAGIVHRDVKPANVFLARGAAGGDHPVLLDFGIAKDLDDPTADLTRSQSWLGTPTYMSPEQIRQSKDVGPASDQWSFGVVLYECLTGSRPFEHEVLLELMKAITDAPARPPHARRASVPEALSDAVARMLSKDPSARFPSMRAVAEALYPFASERVRAWWRPRFGPAAAASRAETVADATTVRAAGDGVPARLPDPEGALPTLMAERVAVSAPPVPLARRSKPDAATLSGQSADRASTPSPRGAAEPLVRYAAVGVVAALAFFAGRNQSPAPAPPVVQPTPALVQPTTPPAQPIPAVVQPTTPPVQPTTPPEPVVDAGATAAVVAARDAGAPSPPPRVTGEPPRPRAGSIQILCGLGRATIGDDTRNREVSLPAAEPIPWPAGHVRVMVMANGAQTQSYIDVRPGRVTTFQDCPGM